MAEKAIVTGVDGIEFANGVYTVSLTYSMTSGSGVINSSCQCNSSNFTPLAPTWRTRVSDAVIATALADYEIEVDGVLFQDFSVLGV